MKLFGILLLAGGALLGVAAATCLADDVFPEMTKESLEAEDGYSPVNDTPAATGNVHRATTTATVIDLVSLDVSVQPVCHPYQWGVAQQQNMEVCYVDISEDDDDDTSAGGGVEKPQEDVGDDTIDTLDVTTDASTAAAANEQDSPSSSAHDTCDMFKWGVSQQNMDVCRVELTEGVDSKIPPPFDADVNGNATDAAADIDGNDSSTDDIEVILESVLRVKKKLRKDPTFRVVLSPGRDALDPPSLGMFELTKDLATGTTPKKVVMLTIDTQVRAVSVTAFRTSNSKESWTFTARDREERDMWTNALVHTINEAATFGQPDLLSDRDSTTSPSDVLELQTIFRGMQPRKVTLTGNKLTMCKIAKGGKATKACKAMTLSESSNAVPAIDDGKDSKKTTRSLFRVMEGAKPSAKSWTFDAGSPDQQARWIAFIKGAIPGTKGDEDKEMDASFSSGSTYTYSRHLALGPPSATPYQLGGNPPAPSQVSVYIAPSPLGPMYPDSRGWKLGPRDKPLIPGEHLSNLFPPKPTTMEVTEIGDILLSPGLYPDRKQDPVWAHRVTAAFNNRANGGLFCAFENWWQRLIMGEEITVKLSVKNGRWRVGRGAMCTLGQSPAPKGSLRRFLPWDERGKVIREASLYLMDDDSVIITFGRDLLWDSKTA